MVALFMVIGLVIGWCLNAASDYLPRFSENQPSLPDGLPLPTIIGVFKKEPVRQPWFRLHLAVEWITAVFFAWLGTRETSISDTLVLAIGFVLFALIAIIDLKYRLVLNIVTYPAMIVMLAFQIGLAHHDPRSILVGGMLAFGVFFMVARLKTGQLGGGDVKLAALIGLTFGFPGVLWALLVGAGAGGMAALILLSRRVSLQYRIPYAPFLCFGAIAVLMYYSFQMAL